MDQVNPPTLDPSILEANLSALRQQEPTLANRLGKALAAPYPVTPAITRDGHLSFRIDYPQGSAGWFGRTSIPSVRASALIDRFDAGQANVLLPGIGQGYVVTLLLSRLGRHRAVFVWEPQDSSILLALHLYDWAQALAEQRLVFVVCSPEQLTETLVAWLADHPGHLCPDRIMMWPWSTPPELASCRASVQAAYHETQSRRMEALESVRAQLTGEQVPHDIRWVHDSSGVVIRAPSASEGLTLHHQEPVARAPGSEKGAIVAFISLHACEATWALSGALSAAGRTLGWNAVEVGVRLPSDVHSLARARWLCENAGRQPDVAILLDTTRHEVRDILPEATPAISWLGPHSATGTSKAARFGPRDLVAVTSSRLRDRLMAAGLEQSRIQVVPHPCVTLCEPLVDSEKAQRPIDLALIADLSPTVPKRFGHRLPTHTQLWNAAVEMIETRIDTFTEDQGDSLLTQAETKLNIRIEDRSIRCAMVEALSACVANTILWRRIAQSFVNNDLKLMICGQGWAGTSVEHLVQPATTLAERCQILRRAKLCLNADVTGEVSSTVLLAAAAGSVLVTRAHPRDTEPGGLATLLEPDREMVTISRVGDLSATLHHLLKKGDFRQNIANCAVARCRAEHFPATRLAFLMASATSFSAGAQPLA